MSGWADRIKEEDRHNWNREHVVVTPLRYKFIDRNVMLVSRWITFHADWMVIRGGTRHKKQFSGYSPMQELELRNYE